MGAHATKLLRGWLVLNGALDVLPLGLAPIFGAARLPGGLPSLLDFYPAFGAALDFRHRGVAFHFITCGVLRILAGVHSSPQYSRLAAFSYAMEFFQHAVEVGVYGSTTFKAAAGCFVVPAVCMALIMNGVLDEKKNVKRE